jgi:hypothetical protein
MMATEQATAVVSGADLGDGLRKRPVAGSETTPLLRPEEVDTKKTQKKVWRIIFYGEYWCFGYSIFDSLGC